jgi:hypothetical protein
MAPLAVAQSKGVLKVQGALLPRWGFKKALIDLSPDFLKIQIHIITLISISE